MSEKPRVLALIPARGGSKGLPRKNVLPVGGKPLIVWTIEAALGARSISRVVLSSDDDEIMSIAREHGCEVPFKRPADLSTDTSSSMDVVLHALSLFPDYDYIVLLQPTSPLRTADDIDSAFSLVNERHAPACVSICAVEESPYWMYEIDQSNRMRNIIKTPKGFHRRQDLPPVYALNGALYIAEKNWLVRKGSFLTGETLGYVMPRERSLDVDTASDLDQVAEFIKRRALIHEV